MTNHLPHVTLIDMDKNSTTATDEPEGVGLVTLEDAAMELGVTRRTIYRWINAGKIARGHILHDVFIHRSELDRVKNLRDNGLWN